MTHPLQIILLLYLLPFTLYISTSTNLRARIVQQHRFRVLKSIIVPEWNPHVVVAKMVEVAKDFDPLMHFIVAYQSAVELALSWPVSEPHLGHC